MTDEAIKRAAEAHFNQTTEFTEEEKSIAKAAFFIGAKWRINTMAVWHYASKKPEFGDTKGVWIVMYFEHGMLYTTFARKDEWYELCKNNNFTRWAYQTDLMPEGKEQCND